MAIRNPAVFTRQSAICVKGSREMKFQLAQTKVSLIMVDTANDDVLVGYVMYAPIPTTVS